MIDQHKPLWIATLSIAIAGAAWAPRTHAAVSGDSTGKAFFLSSDSTDRMLIAQAFDDEALQAATPPFTGADTAPFYYSGEVNSQLAYRKMGEADQNGGIRSRSRGADQAGAGTECGLRSPCPAHQVVDPGTVCLALLGLAGLVAFRRSRFHPDNHSGHA